MSSYRDGCDIQSGVYPTCSLACHAKRHRLVQPKALRNTAVGRICFPEEVRVLPAGAEVFERPVGTSVDVPLALLATSNYNGLETT